MTAIEKVINSNIVKYIIRMTVITFIMLLAFVALLGLGYKFKFLTLYLEEGRRRKWQ